MDIIYWLIIFIVLLIIEIATISLVSIWFCLGSVAAMIASYLCFGLEVQLVVFIVVSAAALFAARPLKKRLKGETEATNVHALVGKTTYVTQTIDNKENTGEIKINDVVWKAVSADGSVIPKETKVVIKEIKGVKAYVSKTE